MWAGFLQSILEVAGRCHRSRRLGAGRSAQLVEALAQFRADDQTCVVARVMKQLKESALVWVSGLTGPGRNDVAHGLDTLSAAPGGRRCRQSMFVRAL